MLRVRDCLRTNLQKKLFRPSFRCYHLWTFLKPKTNHRVWMLGSRYFLRHQYQENWLMKYFNFKCLIWCHRTFFVGVLIQVLVVCCRSGQCWACRYKVWNLYGNKMGHTHTEYRVCPRQKKIYSSFSLTSLKY